MTNNSRRSRKTYTVTIQRHNGTFAGTGEFKTLEGAQGRAAWAREQATTARVITNF